MAAPRAGAAAAAAGARLWRRLWRRPAGVSATLAVLCYINTLHADFVYDDTRAIVTNSDVRGVTPLPSLLRHDFWGTPLEHAGSHGSYRPLTVLTFRLTHALTGLRPAAFHAVNVALHAVCSALVAETAASLGVGRRAALLAGALFAVHPVHAEAVAGLVGRADLLALLFTLCSLLSYARQARGRRSPDGGGGGGGERRWLAAALVSALLAVLCKEQGIAALPLCLLYDVWVHSRVSIAALLTSGLQEKRVRRLRQSCVLVSLACCALLAARLSLLRGRLPWFSAADNPVASCSSRLSRALTLLHLPVVSAGLLLAPHQLSYDWSETAVPLVTSLADSRNAVSALFYAGLAAMFYATGYPTSDTKHKNNNNISVNHNNNTVKAPEAEDSRDSHSRGALLFALSFAVLTFLPASNLFFYVGFLVAERALYAPSVGFCLLVGAGLALAESRWRRLGPAASVLLLTVLAARTVLRNQDWRDERALYTAGVRHSPAKSLGNLATILASQGRLEQAERAYRAALSVRRNMADVHYNLGNLLYSQGKYRQSAACYEDAVGYRRQFAQAYLNLAHAHLKLGQPVAAREVLLACRELSGSRMRDPRAHASAKVGCLVELGRLYAEEDKDPSLALKQYLSALGLAPDGYNKETIYNLIGEAQYRMTNYREAESWFQRALEIQPTAVHAHLFYGKMLAKNKTRVDEAEGWFHRAQTAAPNNYVVYLHYGQFLYETGRLREAAAVYVRGTELAPTEYDLTFNLANVYRELGRYQQAEHFYRRAAHIRPEDVQSHRNLGAILHLTGQLREAEAAYLTALRLSPGDHVTEVNLARLHNVMQRHDLRPRDAGGGAERRGGPRAQAVNGT